MFGKVLEGQDVVTMIENQPTDRSAKPLNKVVVDNCGVL